MEQQIRFCRTTDGSRIAYATVGHGTPLVMTPGWYGHLELSWQDPGNRSYCEALAKYHTFVRYDKLGTGLSDRERTDFSLESEVKTLETLIDHLKLKRVALLGISEGGPIAIAYAATHPRRVSHLILYASLCPRGEQVLEETQAEAWNSWLSLMRASWETMARHVADRMLPEADAATRDFFAKVSLESVTGEVASQMLSHAQRWDITPHCQKIQVPTVVLHRKGDMSVPFQTGRELAAMIPNAHLVPLDGIDHFPTLGDTDSILRNIAEFLGDPVNTSPVAEADEPTARPMPVTQDDSAVLEARSLIAGMDWIVLPRYRVVGNYTRYDEAVRHALKDVKQKIAAAFDRPIRKRENHIIWAAPGSGKTYLVQQVAASLSGNIHFSELNLAKCSEREFLSGLDQLYTTNEPYLCLVDEVDAKPNEAWPYEVLLPHLDATVDKGVSFVFVLVGSYGSSVIELKKMITSRPKGIDLLDRIPSGNEYEIPPMSLGDRLLVVLSQFRLAGKEAGRDIRGVEKLALYYIALNSRLANARQLRELAVRAIERIPTGEDRIKYDHLFGAGDPENKAFWMDSLPAAGNLANRYVTLED